MPEATNTGARSETSSIGMPSSSMNPDAECMEQAESDMDTSFRLHTLRLMLLDRLTAYLPQLRDVGGVRAIPFMQVCWSFFSLQEIVILFIARD
jgi:E3 ubiquitin-protein ligase UBR4